MIRFFFILAAVLWSSFSFAQTVHTNSAGQATAVTGLNVDGYLYNVTSFDSTGVGEVFYWTNAASATAAANAINAALDAAGVSTVLSSGTLDNFYCVGRNTGDTIDSVALAYSPTGWVIDTFAAPYACNAGSIDYHTTWEFVSTATVHTNPAGEATAITGLNVDGTLYNVTSFDGTGIGDVYIWPDAVSANSAAEAVNAALNGANVFKVAAGAPSKLYHCVGLTTANNADSVGSTSEPATSWKTDTLIAPWACTTGALNYHMTWQVVPAGSVQTDPAGLAVSIGGLEIDGTRYNVTSFDSTGVGEVYFWPDDASATAAADAVNAVLNGANVFEVASGGVTNAYHCAGRTTGDIYDSVGSGDENLGYWKSDTIPAGYACGLGGIDYHMTWELVPAGTVFTNGNDEATSISGLDVDGVLYNVTSFDGAGSGTPFFWSDLASAQTAAEAVNAALNGAAIPRVVNGVTALNFSCVGIVGGDVNSSVGSTALFDKATWRTDTISAPWACSLGGIPYHSTWELALGSVAAAIDIVPGDINNVVYPDNDGGPNSGGLNDLIPVIVFSASKLVGDPFDLDTSTINPATVVFGPQQASIAPNSQPEFNVDYDNDGMNDAKFEFLMGDAGLTCDDTDATIVGATSGGKGFEGTDFITTDCDDGGCH